MDAWLIAFGCCVYCLLQRSRQRRDTRADAATGALRAPAYLQSMRHTSTCLLCAAIISLAGCGDDNPVRHEAKPFADAPAKIAGVSFDVSNQLVEVALDELDATGVRWIAVTPFGWQSRFDEPEIRLRTTRVRWGETDAGITETMTRARARGLHTLLKPHIWLTQDVPGQWRGTIGFDNDADWEAWESDYRSFILHYALLAEQQQADMFSIGVELGRVVRERPAFWSTLIGEIRLVYSGLLTYGANWDDAVQVRFWDQLDFIGIHAYFPLTHRSDASVDELIKGWRPHVRLMDNLRATWDRPILFTEIGYRSIAGGAVEPWNFDVQAAVDVQEQADAYEAMFRVFWERDWFAGLFIWEWDADVRLGDDLSDDDDYLPQTKPAQQVMSRWFGASG